MPLRTIFQAIHFLGAGTLASCYTSSKIPPLWTTKYDNLALYTKFQTLGHGIVLNTWSEYIHILNLSSSRLWEEK